jgi:hypothetical protein
MVPLIWRKSVAQSNTGYPCPDGKLMPQWGDKVNGIDTIFFESTRPQLQTILDQGQE